MTKTIIIDGREMTMRASALVPKLYRYHFGRDIIVDLRHLSDAYKKAKDDGENGFSAIDLGIFENIAWLFLKLGGNDVGNDADEWLDSLDGMFSIYEVLPQILDLWEFNLKETAVPKKKAE